MQTKLPAKFLGADQPPITLLKLILNSIKRMFAASPMEIPSGQRMFAQVVPVIEGVVELQPGNSTCRVFTMRTLGALFFVPALYNLNIEIEYVIDGSMNHDTVSYQINVRSSLRAIIWGSIWGSLVGCFVREHLLHETFVKILTMSPDSTYILRFVVQMVVSVFIGAVVVVAFARKKDVQPILSIEDFWGGLFVGFLSSYGGQAFLNQVFEGPIGRP